MITRDIEQRLTSLEKRLGLLGSTGRFLGVEMVRPVRSLRDGYPENSINSAAQILEAILKCTWENHGFKGDPKEKMLHELLGVCKSALPRAIYDHARIIQHRRNAASHHGGEVNSEDALEVVRLTIEIVEWFSTQISDSDSEIQLNAVDNRLLESVGDKSGEQSSVRSMPKHPDELIGRETELQDLTNILRAVLDVDAWRVASRFVMISGESGSGKSAIAQKISWEAAKLGFKYVKVTCEPFHEGMSFFAVREIVRQLVGSSSLVEEISRCYGSHSNQSVLAEFAERPDVAPETRREALVATFSNVVLGRFAVAGRENVPLLIVLDDLEWVDAGTTDALLCLISRLHEGQVLLLGIYRSDLVHASVDGPHVLSRVIEQGRRSGLLHTIDLPMLSRATTRELVMMLLPGAETLPYRFFESLYRITEGNPLFTREIVHGISRGENSIIQKSQDGRWMLKEEEDTNWLIPLTIEDAVRSRLEIIDKEQRSELEIASVIGRRFAFEVINALSSSDEDTVLGNLERFLNFELIRELDDTDESFEFSHGIIRDVLYRSIIGTKRRRIHAQVADVLDKFRHALSEDWDALIGEHYLQARRFEQAIPPLLNAARAAWKIQSGMEAKQLFEKALRAINSSNVLPEGESLSFIQLEYVEALVLTNMYEKAASICEKLIAEQSTDEAAKGWALDHIGDIYWLNGNSDEALRFYAKAQVIAESGDLKDLMVEVAADLCELHDREAERLAGLDEQAVEEHKLKSQQNLEVELTLAKEIGSPQVQSRAHRNAAKACRRAGDLEGAIAEYQRALSFDDPRIATHKVLVSYAKTLRLAGRSEEAAPVFNRVLDWSIQTGAIRSQAIARAYRGLLFLDNEDANAEAELLKSLQLHSEIGYDRGIREVQLLLGELSMREERYSDGINWFRESVGKRESGLSDDQIVNVVLAQLDDRNEILRSSRLREICILLDR